MSKLNVLPRLAYMALYKRLIRGSLKNPVRHYLGRSGFTANIHTHGLTLRCHFGDNRTEQLLAEGRNSEDENLRILTSLLPAGGTFVDIGANCGLYTAVAAKAVGPKGAVLAIEPLPLLVKRIETNLKLNGLKNVQLVHAGVGARKGTLTLHALPHQFGQSSMIQREGSVPVKVPVRTLEDVVKTVGLKRIDVLKIDIEGYEDKALLPYFKAAAQKLWPKHVLMETEHETSWQDDCIAFLAKQGYTKAWQSKNDILLRLEK